MAFVEIGFYFDAWRSEDYVGWMRCACEGAARKQVTVFRRKNLVCEEILLCVGGFRHAHSS